VTLTIQVPQTSAAALPVSIHVSGQETLAGRDPSIDRNPARRLEPFALALLLLPFAGRMRRTGKKLGRAISILLLVVAAITATAGLSGCGASGSGFFAQAPNTYTLTVTGTSGTLSRTTSLTLTVE
jgi:hypothetical protein